MSTPPLQLSPAAERNQGPILAQLLALLPPTGTALEIASGTGQHAAHFAAALPVDADKASAEMGKARTAFLAAMDVLRNAPEATPKIKDELQLADGQWFFFDAALQRLQAANRSAKAGSDVFVTSENLLGVMDKVTGLYAAIKT